MGWKVAKKLFLTKSCTDAYEYATTISNERWTVSIEYRNKITLFLSKYTIVEVTLKCSNVENFYWIESDIERVAKYGNFQGTQFITTEESSKKTAFGRSPFLLKFEFVSWIQNNETLLGYIDIYEKDDSSADNLGTLRQFLMNKQVPNYSGLQLGTLKQFLMNKQVPNYSSVQNCPNIGVDLSWLLQNGLFSDVTLLCGSEVFQAHKAILSTRSPVFAAMFQSSMKEAEDNMVHVLSVKPDVFKLLLEYIYSDFNLNLKQKIDSTNVCEILSAADLYGLHGLKQAVTGHLRSILSECNALNILAFADLYDKNLKEDVLRFVTDKFHILQTTSEWEHVRLENPSLAMDVLTAKINFLSNS